MLKNHVFHDQNMEWVIFYVATVGSYKRRLDCIGPDNTRGLKMLTWYELVHANRFSKIYTMREN